MTFKRTIEHCPYILQADKMLANCFWSYFYHERQRNEQKTRQIMTSHANIILYGGWKGSCVMGGGSNNGCVRRKSKQF